jgi:hypothetical protein
MNSQFLGNLRIAQTFFQTLFFKDFNFIHIISFIIAFEFGIQPESLRVKHI